MRAACRRQAQVIDVLSAAVSTLREGAAALKAENAELRTAYERVGGQGGANGRARDCAGTGSPLARDNQRLSARAEAALHETERSRARLVAIAAEERRRIERDLHDGAQERLIALRIGLSLAQETALVDPARCVAQLDELGRELEQALEELRRLAHGICPPLLADRGLADALASVALRSALPVALHTADVERYSPEIESAVYFCVVEALQNVAKHAVGARGARVEIDAHEPGKLRVEVRDDGACPSDQMPHQGAGITNMRDRIREIGGELLITSTPGRGTLVRADLPIPGHPPALAV